MNENGLKKMLDLSEEEIEEMIPIFANETMEDVANWCKTKNYTVEKGTKILLLFDLLERLNEKRGVAYDRY